MQQTSYARWTTLVLSLFTVFKLQAQVPDIYSVPNTIATPKIDTAYINHKIYHAYLISGYKYDSAIILNNEILLESAKINYKNGIAIALINIGCAYIDKGDLKKGVGYLTKALGYIQSKQMEHSFLAMVYVNFANIYAREGKYDSAAYNYYKALDETEHYTPINYRRLISIYSRVAGFWDIARDDPKALYYAEKMAKLAIEYKDTSNLATSMLIKSNIYTNMQMDSLAIYYCNRTITLSKQSNNIQTLYIAIMDMGGIYVSKKQPEPLKAIPWLQKAIEHNKKINDPVLLIRSYYYLGHAYFLLNNYKKAEEILYKTIALQSKVVKLNDKEMLEAYSDLMVIYKKNGDYKKALATLEKYTQAKDSFLTKEKTVAINQVYAKYQIAEKNKALAEKNKVLAEKNKVLAEKQLQLLKEQNNIKKRDLWIVLISSIFLLLTILFISMFRSNRYKAKVSNLNAIMQGEENERVRIARELHDGIGGMLVSVQLNLGAIKEEYATLGIPKLNDILHMLQDTSGEVRKIAHNLMPDALTRHNFVDALVLYCENMTSGGQLEIDLEFTGDLKELDKVIELFLYRILQELIQNIIKHAKASYAVIQIMRHQGKLSITIEDNGVGFDPYKKNNGYGLQNLQFRIQALGGKIFTRSAEGKGTNVFIEFELQKLKNSMTV